MTAVPTETNGTAHPGWSAAGIELIRRLDFPLAARGPATYQQDFVELYVPNESSLMSESVAEELYRLGHLREPQPSGAYARKVLSKVLADLSWNSSRLEGNRYSRFAAEQLINGGAVRCDVDTVMLLNHKAAVEFVVDCVPQDGLTTLVVRNLHAVLMQDLVPDNGMLGAIRKSPIGIAGTLYSPMLEPGPLEQMLSTVVTQAGLIRNPIEAAVFLWANLAYLQPFENGNECTSRLAANIPLLLHNCTPISFADVAPNDYARAMFGVYELQNAALAVDLFSWTYRRSMNKYSAAKNV
jgi:Fic family protein